ncbi:hypothetical protein NUW58_g6836 [Xylaria curta]|uniref:Uncharacterized protein n=1 Tax=Xylaria curta TaxID=42375 RepID=A0ACC1NPR7_9PEZI|nr:hypothetical protein NUW58_g6836 [Xylaria curta]
MDDTASTASFEDVVERFRDMPRIGGRGGLIIDSPPPVEIPDEDVPDVCYVLQYEEYGKGIVEVRRGPKPIDPDVRDTLDDRNKRERKKSVLEIITVVSTKLSNNIPTYDVRRNRPTYYPARHHWRHPSEDEDDMQITKSENTVMVIKSRHLINALAAVVSYYPGTSFMGDEVRIEAPYYSIIHNAEALLRYKDSQPDTHDAEYAATTSKHIDILLEFLDDTYDESYRRALKMDPTAFCTTFDPYSVGIIDAVAQVLLPSVSGSTTHRGVRAELYKLNVYSGPSGRFKPHVDTPRSSSQFGSLVVCLPVEHEGGQLKVRHKGQEMTFDWSANQDKPDHANRLQWAAFYSDCEHEVLEVTSGHRLTLTYNLYAVRGAGRLTGVSPTLNPTHLPLFQALKGILSQDPFDGQGGTLGFWCSHVYAYNHTKETPLPATLKGVDAVLWESFQALNLDPKIAPVIMMSESNRLMFSAWYNDPGLHTSPWAIRLRKTLPSTMPSEWIIGYKFGVKVDRSSPAEELDDFHKLYQRWGSYSREPVHWLTKPVESELQLIYTAYGNEASAQAEYSNCAILVNVPPYK